MKSIDFEKLICDFMDELCFDERGVEVCVALNDALKCQGFERINGKIVEIEEKKEPRFKVGDIIKHKKKGFTCKIIGVDTEYKLSGCMGSHLPFDAEDSYELVEENKIQSGKWYVCIRDFNDRYDNIIFKKGESYFSNKEGMLIPNNSNIPFKINCIEHYFRPWNIQDAKDGDILREDSCTFIIQKLGDYGTCAKTYCTLYDDGDFYDGSILYFDMDSTKPATKEQCDLLFQKMRESGYKWNAEKLELKKIKEPKREQTNAQLSSFDEAQGTPDVKKNQQDSAWSGEDDVRQTSTIQILEYAKSLDDYNQYGKMDIRNNISWLKTFKDRVQSQSKRGWSEEDEKRRENVMRLIEEANNMYIKEWGSSPFSADILWLKSLKDRHIWKPSDEQIYNMEAAIRAIKYGENVTAYGPILEEILDDLKKIKD